MPPSAEKSPMSEEPAMGLQWVCNGSAMGLQWLYHDYIVILSCLRYASVMPPL